MNFFELEPEKFFSWPSSYDKARREDKLEQMISSGNYMWSLKTDGNYGRFVCQNGEQKLQTRGISKVTDEYGEVQNKVFFFNSLVKAFPKDTIILGEIFLNKGIDKNVGSILRAKDEKAKSIQDEESYREFSKVVKFSAKDRRDIENNDFRNQKLHWRIFDVLYFNGENLLESPLEVRQTYIKKAVELINNPLVVGVKYNELDETFYDSLGKIFSTGGEGVVIYDKKGKPEPGKRTAWKTLKIKQEMSQEVDCFIYGTKPAGREYTGEKIETCKFWENIKTGEKLCGEYFSEYRLGNSNLEPISKGYYYGWPGSIYCAVWDENNNPYIISDCAGLTEDFKKELTNNYEAYHMMPIKISGMMPSTSQSKEGISIRHPKLISIRDCDIDVKDCTLDKIKN